MTKWWVAPLHLTRALWLLLISRSSGLSLSSETGTNVQCWNTYYELQPAVQALHSALCGNLGHVSCGYINWQPNAQEPQSRHHPSPCGRGSTTQTTSPHYDLHELHARQKWYYTWGTCFGGIHHYQWNQATEGHPRPREVYVAPG